MHHVTMILIRQWHFYAMVSCIVLQWYDGIIIDFFLLYADRDCCLGFSISHVTFSEVTSVWGVSAVAILDCSLNVYACGRQKALTVPAYCVAANCNNSQANPKHNYARVPAESTRCEAKMGQICTVQTSWLWCCASVTPICIASTSLSAIS